MSAPRFAGICGFSLDQALDSGVRGLDSGLRSLDSGVRDQESWSVGFSSRLQGL